MCERFRPELWGHKYWLLHHDNTSYFTRDLLTKDNMTVVPTHYTYLRFPEMKIKLEGRHFDESEMIEAELQAMLNTLTEHKL
jgi:hypothetical protein